MKAKSHLSILSLLSLLLLFTSCHRNPHFLTDRTYRQQVEQDYEARLSQFSILNSQLQLDTLSRAEREAMQFLYAYMPYSDLADYTPAFYLDQVRYAFTAREEMPWGKMVPEDIFRHFVLVYRVNNENLDTARQYMFHQLKERVQGMTMEQAALEVNHWCHEHVAYRAADSRTSAPLATMRTSLGRCGEESTFAVTALRSVGIPARQCYTPRWAHCDDNHAWVEVWVANPDGKGGEWKFLGACEPDPELNMGWFAVPSTRCLMVHSKAFGRYHGDEEVVKQTALYSELNLLSHYAPTRRVTATVCGPDGKPLPGATIKFKMYNYAEYYTLATYQADAKGQASLTTGLGDILVWATDGTRYAFSKLDVRKDSTITLTLSDNLNSQFSILNLDIVPPAPGTAKVTPSDEAVARNARRLAYEDSLRNAYTATFPTKDNFKSYLPKDWLWNQKLFSDAQVWEIVQKSEGNYAEIYKYFEHWPAQYRSGEHIYDYLKSYSDKDLRDITADVLQAHETGFDWLDHTKGTCTNCLYTYDVYKKGILPARISNEQVRDWRQPLLKGMTDFAYRVETSDNERLWVKQRTQAEEYKQDYEALKKWTIKNIAVDDTGNYYNCPISPMGVFRLRHADPHSRDIFFVAACRAFDIPAYLDNATNTIYVWDGTAWQKTDLNHKSTTNNSQFSILNSQLTLTYHGKDPAKPIYYPHFTLQKLENGDFRTFDFEDDPRMASFPATIPLEPGTYCLSTGNRYPDGTVLNRMEFFTVKAGERVTKEIILLPLVPRNDNAGTLPKLPEGFEIMDGVELSDYAGETGCILAFLGPHREPAKHLVKEMLEHSAAFRKWGGMTFAVTTDPANRELNRLPNTDVTGIAAGRQDPAEKVLAQTLKLDKYEYPLVAVVDKRGRVLFHSNGYSIGLAEQLLKHTTPIK